jgi:RND superfamily putative drug exporter
MTTDVASQGFLARLGRFCYRRRFVLVSWLVGLVVLMAIGFGFAAPADNDFTGGRSPSARAQMLIKEHFPERRGSSLTVAVQAPPGMHDAQVRDRVNALLAQIAAAPHITAVRSPYEAPGQISPDGTIAFATVQSDINPLPASEVKHLIAQTRTASDGTVVFAMAGAETPYGGASDAIGAIAAMLVILIAFGSLLAMGFTMLAALFGIGSGLTLIFLLGYIFPAPSFSAIVSTLLGLGVGIDYALFIVTRYREPLAEGDSPEDAVAVSVARAGRSVLFAGATVVIAMLRLFVVQQRLLNATAVAASVTVLMTMISAITVLPALLAFAGRHIDRFKLPYLGRIGAQPARGAVGPHHPAAADHQPGDRCHDHDRAGDSGLLDAAELRGQQHRAAQHQRLPRPHDPHRGFRSRLRRAVPDRRPGAVGRLGRRC